MRMNQHARTAVGALVGLALILVALGLWWYDLSAPPGPGGQAVVIGIVVFVIGIVVAIEF